MRRKSKTSRILLLDVVKPNDRPHFMPGDDVAGTCIANIDFILAQEIQRIDVVFTGRSEIRFVERLYNTPHPYNTINMFFEQRQTVMEFGEKNMAAAGHYTLPFLFSFPSLCDQTGLEAPGSKQFRLPPSMNHRGSSTDHSRGNEPICWDGTTRIVYELEAHIIGLEGHCTHRISTEVQFVPYARNKPGTSLLRVRRNVTVESPHLRPYSTQSKFRRILKRATAKLPRSNFKIILDVPTRAISGQDLELYLGVDYDVRTSTAEELPDVYLTKMAILYYENIEIGHRSRSHKKGPLLVESPGSRRYISASWTSNPVVITKRLNIQNCLPPGALRLVDVSFQTPNILRFYDRFEVQLTILCANRDIHIHYPSSRELFIYAEEPAAKGTEFKAESLSMQPEWRPLSPVSRPFSPAECSFATTEHSSTRGSTIRAATPMELADTALAELPPVVPEIDTSKEFYEMP